MSSFKQTYISLISQGDVHNRCSRLIRYSAAVAAIVGTSACSLSDLVKSEIPSSVSNPDEFNTPNGAVARYRGAILQFNTATSGTTTPENFIVVTGLFSDELSSGQYTTAQTNQLNRISAVDSRSLSEDERVQELAAAPLQLWRSLSGVRMRAQDALYALKTYAPNASPALSGHAYAMQGIAEVMMAELFCSGIPLSTILPNNSFIYGSAQTTQQVLEHARLQFDSAVQLSADSARLLNFARVGLGRALLNLGQFDQAAQAVANVPTDFKYQNYHSTTLGGAVGVPNFTVNIGFSFGYGTVADREGINGLPFVSANDPRVVVTRLTQQDDQWPLTPIYSPDKWAAPTRGTKPVTVADGIEARLIEAEAALRNNDARWLTILNALRTSCTNAATCPTPAPAGTGGVPGLAMLNDPATQAERIDLLFRERAYWLFLTGHRQGDLRRLVRQYSRLQDQVFPTGRYPIGPLGNYGNAVNLPVPATERLDNPNYKGCLDRNP